MQFYIRFRSQLRRIRPELIASLEDFTAKAASAAGGRVEAGRKVLAAFFDEEWIGFWLDMVIFLEKIHRMLERSSAELYGYVIVIGRDIAETSARRLYCSRPKTNERRTGIWCSQEICKALEQYMAFNAAESAGGSSDGNTPGEAYRELREWRSFSGTGRSSPYQYYTEALGNTPALIVRFGSGGSGLICFADAFTPQMRLFIADTVSADTLAELNAIHALLFQERLRDEWSDYITGQGQRFVRSLLKAYITALKARKASGALILENLQLADSMANKIIEEAYFSLGNDTDYLITKYTAGNFSAPQTINYKQKNIPQTAMAKNIPYDLLEIAYNIVLLRRYFPAYLFPKLIEEEGLSEETYSCALAMLVSLGVFAEGEPHPLEDNFASRAEKALGARREKIHRAVRKIILDWVASGRLRPCFNLLKILLELGGRAGDDLILRSLKADVLNGTSAGFVKSFKKGSFALLAGNENVKVLSYIFKTLKVLSAGREDDIQRVFLEPPPPLTLENNKPCYPAYRAQVQLNRAAFYVANRNTETASDELRKLMLLNRELGKNAVPAYRLFSLMNLSRNYIDDALEYIAFALEQAERMEQGEELVLTCYYAASINLLHGNLSKAQRLALNAEKTALALGQSPWLMRTRFLRGRILFETGRYSDALEVFESLDNPSGDTSQSAMMRLTVRAWIYRTNVFIGRVPSDGSAHSAFRGIPAQWKESLDGTFLLDGKIFEIEAAYYAGNYEKVITLSEGFLAHEGAGVESRYSAFLFTEQPDWSSGFAQCENMYLAGGTLWKRMAWVYRIMAQSALQPSPELKAELLGAMQRFMREESLPNTDPNDAFYFYAWYNMLQHSGAGQVDMHTVLSMAYRRLQRRAVRIDDTATRQAYLSLPRWSSALCRAAREYKLI